MGGDEDVRCQRRVKTALSTKNRLVREFLAEFLGTLILIAIGNGSVAQKVLSRGGLGEYISVNFAYGLGVSLGVWVSGGVTGGHINPAVTLANNIMGRLPWSKLPIYWLGQYLGAMAGAAVVYGVYWDAINAFDGGVRITDPAHPNATAGIFAVYPPNDAYISTATAFGDQVVGTGILLICVMSITDKNNMQPPKGMVPLCVGLVVVAIGMSFGFNAGYAINPARDWGPRIFTAMAGWGTAPFTFRNYNWFWVPFVGPHVGAILGSWIYLVFVGNHFDEEKEEDDQSKADKQDQMMELEMKGHSNQGYNTNVTKVPSSDYKVPSYGTPPADYIGSTAGKQADGRPISYNQPPEEYSRF